MEIVIILLVLASVASNFYLANKVQTIVNLPAPVVNVTVEAPEAVELDPIEVAAVECKCEHELFQIIVEKLNQPTWIPQPVPMPPMPTYPTYPQIISGSDTGQATAINEKEIDGVPGRQFPAR